MKCSYCGATEGFAYVPHELESGGAVYQLECGECGKKVDPKGQEEEVAAAKRYVISVMKSNAGIKENEEEKI